MKVLSPGVMDNWVEIEFIGGPLDGPGRVHPTMNSRLSVQNNPEGVYVFTQQPPDWKPTYVSTLTFPKFRQHRHQNPSAGDRRFRVRGEVIA